MTDQADERPPLIVQALMHAATTGDTDLGAEVLGLLDVERARRLSWVLARILASVILHGTDVEDIRAPDDASALLTDDDPRGHTP